eukprot:TRINITY_DN34993_c0_g1_i1.p1 TRINITY_DN34993_c0_g1~~TRINITY_DN34993_c0_g1_i1.p1  ORF type:complete len:1124 (+),score=191.28 TRINITY_DN34993_c0_g1_i1:97-3372(+)
MTSFYGRSARATQSWYGKADFGTLYQAQGELGSAVGSGYIADSAHSAGSGSVSGGASGQVEANGSQGRYAEPLPLSSATIGCEPAGRSAAVSDRQPSVVSEPAVSYVQTAQIPHVVCTDGNARGERSGGDGFSVGNAAHLVKAETVSFTGATDATRTNGGGGIGISFVGDGRRGVTAAAALDQPSFYRKGATGAPSSRLQLHAPRSASAFPENRGTEAASSTARSAASRGNDNADRGSTSRNMWHSVGGSGGGAGGEDYEAPAAAGDTVSIAPKRAQRALICRDLDKDIAACTSGREVFAVAARATATMDAPNWANLVYALAHLKKNGDAAGLSPSDLRANPNWSKCCREFRNNIADLTARDSANVLWSMATLESRSEPLFMDVADALPSKLSVCDPISVSKAAWALTAMPQREKRFALFAQLSVPVVLRAEVFPLGALTMTCYAFAKAQLRDAEVYAALSSAISRFPDEELRPIDVCNVVWAFCTVGYRDDDLFDRLCAGHLVKQEAVANFNPQDLSNTTWGLSKVAYIHQIAMDTLAEGGIARRDEFKAIHFSNFFYSFAMLRLRGPDGFLTTMADTAVKKISTFDSGNLAIAVWALAQLRERHQLIDEALTIARQPAMCTLLGSRALSMLFLACFRLGRVADIDSLFDAARSCKLSIGASGFSAVMMTGEQHYDAARERRLAQAMADEADDDRMRAVIGNAAAIRLMKRQRPDEAISLLRDLRASGPRRWSAVSSKLLARLELARSSGGASASAVPSSDEERETWQRPVVSGIHPIAATRQNEGPHAYTREFMTLQAVLCGAPAGDVDACMAAVEQFAESRSLWLKITAWEKSVVVHEAAKLARPKVAVEIGAYVGYSAMNIARALRPFGGRVASIEVDPVHVTIVRNMVEHAGLTDNVDVWTGYCYDVIPHLLEAYGPRSIGMVFMDQKGTRFHTDLKLMEELDLLDDGALILADNVLKPGAPLYIWHLLHGPYSHCTAISVREFLLQSEDWMVMGFHDPSRGPVQEPPSALHRVAFESDNFRKRSMFDNVAPSKSDWWAFSQRFVDGLDRCGSKPPIVGLHGRDNPVIVPEDIASIFDSAGRLRHQ